MNDLSDQHFSKDQNNNTFVNKDDDAAVVNNKQLKMMTELGDCASCYEGSHISSELHTY